MTATTKKEYKYVKPQTKGMVTIPKEFREELGIDENTILTVKLYKNGVFFQKLVEETHHLESYAQKKIKEFLQKNILDKKTFQQLEKLLK